MDSSVEVANNPLQLTAEKTSRFKLSQAGKKAALGYLFLSPFLILFIVFTVVPVIQSIYLSFTYYNMLQPAKWVGLSNYSMLVPGRRYVHQIDQKYVYIRCDRRAAELLPIVPARVGDQYADGRKCSSRWLSTCRPSRAASRYPSCGCTFSPGTATVY